MFSLIVGSVMVVIGLVSAYILIKDERQREARFREHVKRVYGGGRVG